MTITNYDYEHESRTQGPGPTIGVEPRTPNREPRLRARTINHQLSPCRVHIRPPAAHPPPLELYNNSRFLVRPGRAR